MKEAFPDMHMTLRMGAAHYDLSVTDRGQTSSFDLAALTKEHRNKVRRLIRDAFKARQDRQKEAA